MGKTSVRTRKYAREALVTEPFKSPSESTRFARVMIDMMKTGLEQISFVC